MSESPLQEDTNSVSPEQIRAPSDPSSTAETRNDIDVSKRNPTPSFLDAIQSTWNWLNEFNPWGQPEAAQQSLDEVLPATALPSISVGDANSTTLNDSLLPVSNTQQDLGQAFDWFAGLLAGPQVSQDNCVAAVICPPIECESNDQSDGELAITGAVETTPPILSQLVTVSSSAINDIHSGVENAMIAGIRAVSSERDRDEIIRWFISARDILSQETSTTQKASDLYESTDTLRLAQLVGNTFGTSVYHYYGANLPLALKVALPVTLIGAGYFGMQGAGILAFGTGIGLPVVLLLFLGTAGATTVLEAFVKDRSVRDPLTKLLLMFVAFESARRAKKELLDAMRADAMVPERANVPSDPDGLLAFLMQMDPVAFERHIMSFFEQDGHPTGLTARSNDFGVDGYVFHPDGVIVVQCKRYGAENPVGRPAIQQFKGVIEEQRAFKGYFVTTSRFTDEAVESAAKSSRIILVNGEDIVRWHKEGRKLS